MDRTEVKWTLFAKIRAKIPLVIGGSQYLDIIKMEFLFFFSVFFNGKCYVLLYILGSLLVQQPSNQPIVSRDHS